MLVGFWGSSRHGSVGSTASLRALWMDTVAKNPELPGWRTTISGSSLADDGDLDTAAAQYTQAGVRLKPDYTRRRTSTSENILQARGKLQEAIAQFYTVVLRVQPTYAEGGLQRSRHGVGRGRDRLQKR